MITVEIDDAILIKKGYIKADKFAATDISIHRAADIIGISNTTLRSYIDLGLFPQTNDGKVRLTDALLNNAIDLKRRYLDYKNGM